MPAPHRVEKTGYSDYYEENGVLEPISYRILVYVMPMTSEESALVNQLYNQLKTAIDAAIVDFMTCGVTDASYESFQNTLRQIGSEEYRAIYQQVYDRYLAR